MYQQTLSSELQQIKEDSQLLPEMFREEAKLRNALQTEFDQEKELLRTARRDDKMLRDKVRNLTDEVERKKRLAM